MIETIFFNGMKTIQVKKYLERILRIMLCLWQGLIQRFVGCIMLSSYKDDVYKNVKWISEDNNNLYIHRLAVHPRFQKKGIC
ncbi:MAG: hypothetical protein CM15mP109_13390 [Candidatus Dadabacteria bacterium]|nr:MAG: hypothetical protein CM15mP109_13390 [Candidatus Dadabacteria bacterium]